MDINTKISKMIKATRLKRGMSVRDLACLSQVSIYTIYRIEDHRGIPRIETLDMIFKALGCTLVIGGESNGRRFVSNG